MRQFLFSLIFAGLGIGGFAQVQNYSVGQVVENFTVTDTKGAVHNLYDITASGKYVFIDFFFVTCPPCQQTQKYFNELHDKYGCNQGEVYTLSISDVAGNTNAAIDQYENTYGGSFNHSPAAGIEGGGIAAGQNIGIIAYPTYFLIGPDNKLVNKDIWPISSVVSYENAFPPGFNPQPIECMPMSTQEIETSGFTLFPTVSDGKLTVSLDKTSDASVYVFNLAGQRVFSKQYKSLKNIKLDLNLTSGVYVMKVQTSGDRILSKKFVIK